MKFFDTHCHLAHDELRANALELADRAHARGVRGLAVIAADEASLRATPGVVEAIRKHQPGLTVVGTAGLHPHEATTITDAGWTELERAAQTAAAIGETGLDYHYNHSGPEEQKRWFARHIELSVALKKPLVIHCREAAPDILAALDTPGVKNHPNPGILHCFTEDLPTARRLVDLGFYISFSGIMTFRNAESLRNVARALPLERLLIETDSPWLAPIPNRGKLCEPAFVMDTFECLTTLRSESREELAAALWRNSCRVFNVAEGA